MTTTTAVVTLGQAVEKETGEDTVGHGQVLRPASRLRRICERGMVSAEWAVGLIAAIAIAGVLVSIVTSGPVRDALLHVILSVIGWISSTLGGIAKP
jgi:hypothetical protein